LKQREWGGAKGEGEGESQAGSPLSSDSDMVLNRMTQRS